MLDPFVPERFYHYTSMRGLEGIVRKNQMWATSIRYLNDATEYMYTVTLARTCVNAIAGISEGERRLFRYLLDDSAGPQGGDIDQVRRLGGLRYVVSLSCDGDSLPQWRAYAPKSGYAISWPRVTLEKFAAASSFQLCQCIYDEDEQRRRIDQVLMDTLAEWKSSPVDVDLFDFSSKKIYGSPDQMRVRNFRNQFDGRMSELATVFKSVAFKPEQEWRLVSRQPDESALPTHFREGRSVLIPYIIFKLESPNANWWTEHRWVTCGPSPETELSELSARHLVTLHKWMGTDVRRSIVPYRDW